jgi:hypothetical protein
MRWIIMPVACTPVFFFCINDNVPFQYVRDSQVSDEDEEKEGDGRIGGEEGEERSVSKGA